MAKQPNKLARGTASSNPVDRLRLRVSEMIHSPRAQAAHRATIWRIDSDTDAAWSQVLGELAETDGLELTHNEDGTVQLQWTAADQEEEMPPEDVCYVDELTMIRTELAPEVTFQQLLQQPAPF
ncbi:DUF1654 domain-containing protein [Pseudomonas nitroreducens]|uniref:DUF1654 domain-containing protein n=1 Tax=Pseudomonas nitroreducens TaxID=46680 RepID=UPI003CC823AF